MVGLSSTRQWASAGLNLARLSNRLRSSGEGRESSGGGPVEGARKGPGGGREARPLSHTLPPPLARGVLVGFQMQSFSNQLIYADNHSLNVWRRHDPTPAVAVFSQETPGTDHHRLANRAIVRTRLKEWQAAEQDARESIKVKPTILGHVALSIALGAQGELASAKQKFNQAFLCDEPKDDFFLLLVKAVVIFMAGGHNEATKRVTDLTEVSEEANKPLHRAVRAQMQLVVGKAALDEGDHEEALRSLRSAVVFAPFSKLPELETISLIFGWDFDSLPLFIRQQTCKALYARMEVNYSSLPNAPSSPAPVGNVPPELKTEGSDWFAVFNPKVKRVLDVSLIHTLMHESVVCCVRFSADGKFFATGCNHKAQIYDTKTGAKICALVDGTARKADMYIRSVCFSPDGKYLATGAEDNQIRVWDISKKRIRNFFDVHHQEVYSIDFSPDGRFIVSGSSDKTVQILDMVDGSSKVLAINDPNSLNSDAGMTSVTISPNGQLVAAGSLGTDIRIWDIATGILVERLRGHRDSINSVVFTPDGKGLVSGSLDKTLKYWDVSGLMNAVKRRDFTSNGKELEKASQCTMDFVGHTDYVLSVAVSSDGQWVVSGSKDRGVQFWSSQNATLQCVLQGHMNSVISVALSPAGNILATGSGDWRARIWSYQTI